LALDNSSFGLLLELLISIVGVCVNTSTLYESTVNSATHQSAKQMSVLSATHWWPPLRGFFVNLNQVFCILHSFFSIAIEWVEAVSPGHICDHNISCIGVAFKSFIEDVVAGMRLLCCINNVKNSMLHAIKMVDPILQILMVGPTKFLCISYLVIPL
jgi:hypothetical protein